jgi:L-gulonolactone oxidase
MWTNWAGTVEARVDVQSPTTVTELRDAVRTAAAAGKHVKPIGAGHSFTAIGATDGVQLRLDGLSGIVRADHETGLVTVNAGTRLSDLNEALWHLDLSLSNLGDIDVQTIAGAISTGTHGTGAHFGGLATQVRGLRLVTAGGELVDCSRGENPELYSAARIGLGALGVIATVTLQCEPAFGLAASETPGDLDETLEDLDTLVDANDHFEFYWFPHTRRVLTKRNNRVRAGTPLNPLKRTRRYIDDELLANTVYERINRITARRPRLIPRANAIAARALNPRDYIDRSYRVFTSPRRVRFREMEYALPRAAVPEMLAGIQAYLEGGGEQIGFPVEVRFAASDDIWLSTAYGRETGYVAVHQYARRDHDAYFRAVEALAVDLGGRPHWGKLHYREAADLRDLYPRFDSFVELRNALDPDRVFANDYLTAVLGD